jgi:hypothetical protein
MKGWVFDPHSGGVRISPLRREVVKNRILRYAEKHYAGKYARIDVRFRGALCYVDAYETEEGREVSTHLCRMRHFDEDRWSVAFYTYSNERYEPCIFPNGEWFGTVEEAFDIGAVYLQ